MDIHHLWEDYLHSSHGSSVNRGSIPHCCTETAVLHIVLLCKNRDDFASQIVSFLEISLSAVSAPDVALFPSQLL